VLDRVDETIVAGLESGLSEATRVYRDRLARLEIQCRDAGLIWPAEVIVEMIGQHDRYIEHDARFSPEHLSELIGELLIRCDAIRNNTGAVPQLLVRGTAKDQWTDLASARFIGLGCGVRTGRKSATLTSYLQDANSGSMVAVQREFADPPDDSKETPKPFWQLAQTPVVKGATFAQVGAGQLLTQGGKRATDHQLVLGRAKATVNPQNFSWESLRPPVLAENFAEIRARLGALPPASLRPRRVAEDFHVCQIAAVEQAVFASDVQMIHAIVKDSTGDTAVLHHPYTSRGSEGAERLLGRLNAKSQSVQFVAGPTRLTSEGLRIEPISVILRDSNRSMLQPWIDRLPESTSTMAPPNQTRDDPIAEMGKDLAKTIGDLLVVGLYRADPTICRSLQEVVRTAESMGLARMASAIRRVENGLAGKSSAMNWNWRPTGLALLDLVVLSRLLQESK
jgi:hypothetical protein